MVIMAAASYMLGSSHDKTLLMSIYFFRRLVSEIARSIVTIFCHMFDGDCNL